MYQWCDDTISISICTGCPKQKKVAMIFFSVRDGMSRLFLMFCFNHFKCLKKSKILGTPCWYSHLASHNQTKCYWDQVLGVKTHYWVSQRTPSTLHHLRGYCILCTLDLSCRRTQERSNFSEFSSHVTKLKSKLFWLIFSQGLFCLTSALKISRILLNIS